MVGQRQSPKKIELNYHVFFSQTPPQLATHLQLIVQMTRALASLTYMRDKILIGKHGKGNVLIKQEKKGAHDFVNSWQTAHD